MTRLRTEDIENIPQALRAYDQELLSKTGHTLRGIACHALGLPEHEIESAARSCRVCVVPITYGQGTIPGFGATVSGIVSHLGFHSVVTERPDVDGTTEAIEKESDIILMADDDRFVAINTHSGSVSDNTEMTAKGFVAGLDLMTGGLAGQATLVIGCGDLGFYSAKTLLARGAQVTVSDIDHRVALRLQEEIREALETTVCLDNDWRSSPGKYPNIIDATPTADFIDASMIRADSFVAVPGVPCGLNPAARDKLSHRYLHDTLQIGVATMVLDALTHDG